MIELIREYLDLAPIVLFILAIIVSLISSIYTVKLRNYLLIKYPKLEMKILLFITFSSIDSTKEERKRGFFLFFKRIFLFEYLSDEKSNKYFDFVLRYREIKEKNDTQLLKLANDFIRWARVSECCVSLWVWLFVLHFVWFLSLVVLLFIP